MASFLAAIGRSTTLATLLRAAVSASVTTIIFGLALHNVLNLDTQPQIVLSVILGVGSAALWAAGSVGGLARVGYLANTFAAIAAAASLGSGLAANPDAICKNGIFAHICSIATHP